MDAATQLMIAAIPTVMASLAVGAVARGVRSRDSLGERVGELESRLDFQDGRRQGFRDGHAAAKDGRGPNDG